VSYSFKRIFNVMQEMHDKSISRPQNSSIIKLQKRQHLSAH